MNRAVWIARVAGVLIILGTILLLMNLHARLTRLSRDQPPTTVQP